MSAFDPKRTCAESFRCGAILGSDLIDCQLCPGTIYQAPGLHRVDRWRPVVANKAKYVDLFVALGNVGRVIEIFNPNRWMILARWAQIKLVGSKYRAHFPIMTLHPAAQFDPVFRNLVKTEVAKLSTENELPTENDLVAEARCDSCAALY